MDAITAANAAVAAAMKTLVDEAETKHAAEIALHKKALSAIQVERDALRKQVAALQAQLEAATGLSALAKPASKGKAGKSSSNAAAPKTKADDMEMLAQILEDNGQDEIYRSFKDGSEVGGTWDAEAKTITISSYDSHMHDKRPITCTSLSQFAKVAGICHYVKNRKPGDTEDKQFGPINGWKACYILSPDGETRRYLDSFRK